MGTPGGLTHPPSPSSHGPSPAVTPPLPLSPLGSPLCHLPSVGTSAVTPFPSQGISLLCCHTPPSVGTPTVSSGWPPAVILHPTVILFPWRAITLSSPVTPPSVASSRRHAFVVTLFRRWEVTPLASEGPLCTGVPWSFLSHCSLFWGTRPFPGAGRDWPSGSREPSPAPVGTGLPAARRDC